MTEGHRHRFVKVKKEGLLARVLSTPIYYSTDYDRVDRSPYPWGLPSPESRRYYLSPLSIAHRWTGLTLWFRDEGDQQIEDISQRIQRHLWEMGRELRTRVEAAGLRFEDGIVSCESADPVEGNDFRLMLNWTPREES